MLKTHKATAKRMRITGSGKLMQKQRGQDHFNARDTGKVTRSKRRLIQTPKAEQKTIRQLLPYS